MRWVTARARITNIVVVDEENSVNSAEKSDPIRKKHLHHSTSKEAAPEILISSSRCSKQCIHDQATHAQNDNVPRSTVSITIMSPGSTGAQNDNAAVLLPFYREHTHDQNDSVLVLLRL